MYCWTHFKRKRPKHGNKRLTFRPPLKQRSPLHRWLHESGAVIAKVVARNATRKANNKSTASAPKYGCATVGGLSSEQLELQRKVVALTKFQDALLHPPETVDSSGGTASFVGVTMEKLALASHQCGAHARALRHYETWLRHRKGHLNNAARNSFDIKFTDDEVCPATIVYTRCLKIVHRRSDSEQPLDAGFHWTQLDALTNCAGQSTCTLLASFKKGRFWGQAVVHWCCLQTEGF
jgi:hypothetical protein